MDLASMSGAFQESRSLGTDVMVTALNAAGDDYVYLTYTGGSDDEVANHIAADISGNEKTLFDQIQLGML